MLICTKRSTGARLNIAMCRDMTQKRRCHRGKPKLLAFQYGIRGSHENLHIRSFCVDLNRCSGCLYAIDQMTRGHGL